jgi:hypothetical protein
MPNAGADVIRCLYNDVSIKQPIASVNPLTLTGIQAD